MAYFEFPHTRTYEGDLGYIIEKLTELSDRYNVFFAENHIKFADPIQWDITKQYEPYTIVSDSDTETAYISKQPVPAGIAITNTDYWEVVGVLTVDAVARGEIETILRFITNIYESGSTATAARTAGDYVIVGGKLYIVTDLINTDDTYTPGVNITATTVENMIKNIFSLSIKDNFVTPEMFGAAADGITNDYQAFRDCADYAYTNKKDIFLPGKLYRVVGDNPLGVPYNFVETYERYKYTLNINGGDSVIFWEPSEITDRFINGQHLRHSTIQNIRIKQTANTPKGSFISTKTSDGLSHTFSCNTIIECNIENVLKCFDFDSTGATATHDDLSVFINVSASCNIFYYTTNGNSVNHNFYGCNWSDYQVSTGGSFVYVNVNNWAGGLNCYGCHFTTDTNDIIFRLAITNKRHLSINGCRLECYGTGVKLLSATSGVISVNDLETVLLTDDYTHAFIELSGNAAVKFNNCSVPGDTVIVKDFATVKFDSCLFANTRTVSNYTNGVKIDTVNSTGITRGKLSFYPAPLHNKFTFYGNFANNDPIEKVTYLSSIAPNGVNQIVDRGTIYYCPYELTATFNYKPDIEIQQTNPEYALYVNNTLVQKVSVTAPIENVTLHKGDTINFKFYKNNSDTDIAEIGGFGISSSYMELTYTCN